MKRFYKNAGTDCSKPGLKNYGVQKSLKTTFICVYSPTKAFLKFDKEDCCVTSQKNAWVGGYIPFANLRSGVLFSVI